MSEPTAGIQSLTPSAVIQMIEVDSSAIGGSVDRFYNGTNELGEALVWQGETYIPLPYQIEGLEQNTKGTLPRPIIRVSNLDGTISALIGPLDDLLGAKVSIKRTQKCFLDAVNFADGNATADPDWFWPDEVFEIEQKLSETRTMIEFQLVSYLDRQGKQIPAEKFQATVCRWHDASICTYSTGTTCDHTLDGDNGCKVKWGANAALPFGGFPGCSRIR